MLRRSRAREVALQLLFQADQNKKPMSPAAVKKFLKDRLLGDEPSMTFATSLFDGVMEHRAAIDQTLVATATNWRLPRMLPSDRNILRLATFELLHRKEVEAVPVILNEAIELAKRFGTVDSASFVNGILDQISKHRFAPKPVAPTPVEAVVVAPTPVEAKPIEAVAVEPPPVVLKPTEADPVETTPVEPAAS